jgi:hypothetical protein
MSATNCWYDFSQCQLNYHSHSVDTYFLNGQSTVLYYLLHISAANMLVVNDSISKKYFRPGRMVPSEWTRYVRAVRDIPVADYSAPGLNSTRGVPYRPLIAVSPFRLILSVSYYKRSLWRCGQL